MTRPRNDDHSTEFGLWLRRQPALDSRAQGFVASNVDYIWRNYRTGHWMLIEEKRHGAHPQRWQSELFEILDNVCQADPLYRGFHIIVFEHTSPDDGRSWIDGEEASGDQVIAFLRFCSGRILYLATPEKRPPCAPTRP